MFTGRVVQPGEPEFLPEDTDGAIALGMEERDTCPACGLLKDWCRALGNQFAFEAQAERCHVTYAMERHRGASDEDAIKSATQRSVRFRDGHEPDLLAGLDLGVGDQDDRDDQG